MIQRELEISNLSTCQQGIYHHQSPLYFWRDHRRMRSLQLHQISFQLTELSKGEAGTLNVRSFSSYRTFWVYMNLEGKFLILFSNKFWIIFHISQGAFLIYTTDWIVIIFCIRFSLPLLVIQVLNSIVVIVKSWVEQFLHIELQQKWKEISGKYSDSG